MQWLVVILIGLVALDSTHRIYLNVFTHSLPSGVYLRIDGQPQRNSYAASCLTPEIVEYGISRSYLARGVCSTGTVPVLKLIKGIPGDHFVIQNGFLKLNGDSYTIIDRDSSGRTLQLFYQEKHGILGKGQYILLSDFVPNSWDSRYWGPVGIQFLLKPLWIFENVKK